MCWFIVRILFCFLIRLQVIALESTNQMISFSMQKSDKIIIKKEINAPDHVAFGYHNKYFFYMANITFTCALTSFLWEIKIDNWWLSKQQTTMQFKYFTNHNMHWHPNKAKFRSKKKKNNSQNLCFIVRKFDLNGMLRHRYRRRRINFYEKISTLNMINDHTNTF